MPNHEALTEDLLQYRASLVSARATAQGERDKQLLTLSTAALAFSSTLMQKFFGLNAADSTATTLFIILAWTCWGFVILSVVLSLGSTSQANATAIRQIDSGTIYEQKPGRYWDSITTVLNIASSTFFVLGILFFILFSATNIKG